MIIWSNVIAVLVFTVGCFVVGCLLGYFLDKLSK